MLPWQPARHQFCVAQDRVPGGLGPVVGPPCSFLGLILPTLPIGNRIFLGKAAAPLSCQRRTAVPCSRVSSDISIKGTGRHPWMLGAAGFRISLHTLPSCSPMGGSTPNGSDAHVIFPMHSSGALPAGMRGPGLAGISMETQVPSRMEELEPSVLPLLINSVRGERLVMTSQQMLSFYSSCSHLWQLLHVPSMQAGAWGWAGQCSCDLCASITPTLSPDFISPL